MKALEKMIIPLPDLEKQNRVALNYQAKIDEIKVLKLKIQRAEHELKYIFEEK